MQNIISFNQNLDYFLKLIDSRMENGDFLGALDAGRRAIENVKTRVDKQSLNIILGQIYFEMGLYFLSCEHFFRAMQVAETRASALFGVGRNLVKLNDYKLALQYFEATLSTTSTQDFSGAILEWTRKIKEKINNIEIEKPLFSIAKNLIKLGKYEQAIMSLGPSFAKNDLIAKIYTADALVLSGQNSKAREIVFDILKTDTENVAAWLVLCNICLAENDLTSLEINLSKCENFSLDTNQMFLVANLYFNANKWEKSVILYEKLLKNDNYNIKIMLYCAIAYYNLGDKENALYAIGRARWVDIENPILNIYYDIFQRDLVQPPLKLTTNIPKKVAENKINSIFSLIDSGSFCENITTSLTLGDDLDWCFTNKNNILINKLSGALSKCKKKKALKLYKKYLLSVRLNKEQKFYLTKHALLAQNLTQIDLSYNLNYKSFYTKISKNIKKNSALFEGYCNAFSFAILNNIKINFDKITKKILKNLENKNLKAWNERVYSCVYFCENAKILNQVCRYFEVNQTQVLSAINEFELLL